MKKKFKLENLKVKSFITDEDALNSETIKGGNILIPWETNRCSIIATQNCPTRFGLTCNQVTQVNCITVGINCNLVTRQVNCNVITQGICIRPTVIGPGC